MADRLVVLRARFVAACSAYDAVRARRLGGFGGRAWAVIGIVVVLHMVNSPWRSQF